MINQVTKDKLWMWLVWKLPRRLIEWAVSRAFAHATSGKYSNTLGGSLTVVDMMQRWEKDNAG